MQDLTGNKFHRLTVLGFIRKDRHYNSYWLCRCDCGNETAVTAGRLRSGHTKSCGCYSIEKAKETCIKRNTTHGLSEHRLYNIWCNMKERCFNPNNPDYIKWYGSRGITICDEWKNSFQSFYDWAINNGYSDELSIDRKDVNGNYEPGNCRWATAKEQVKNQRKRVVNK